MQRIIYLPFQHFLLDAYFSDCQRNWDHKIVSDCLMPTQLYHGEKNTQYSKYQRSAWLCKLQKRCTRLAAASDKVYQLLVHGRWFSPGTPASSTTKTGRHDIAESGVKTPKIKSNQPKKQNLSVCVCIKSHNFFSSLFFFILSGFNSFVY